MADEQKSTKPSAVPAAADGQAEAAKAKREAEAKAKADAKVAARAEVEAKAAAEGAAKTLWKDDPKAKMERVFRAQNPPTNVALTTLNRLEGSVDGVRIPERAIAIAPSSGQQYILAKNVEEYDKQLAALRIYEEQGKIKEVDPKNKGVTWVPKRQIELNALRQKLAKLESDESAKVPYEDAEEE